MTTNKQASGAEESTNRRHHWAMTELNDVADRLESMSDAAQILGNKELSLLLADLYADTRAAVARAGKAFNDEAHAHYQTTLQGTANMIGACMAIDQKRAPSAD